MKIKMKKKKNQNEKEKKPKKKGKRTKKNSLRVHFARSVSTIKTHRLRSAPLRALERHAG